MRVDVRDTNFLLLRQRGQWRLQWEIPHMKSWEVEGAEKCLVQTSTVRTREVEHLFPERIMMAVGLVEVGTPLKTVLLKVADQKAVGILLKIVMFEDSLEEALVVV